MKTNVVVAGSVVVLVLVPGRRGERGREEERERRREGEMERRREGDKERVREG